MNFSDFLKNIYKIKNNIFTTQEVFMYNLFKSANPDFSYTEDYAKKILNGTKPLSQDFIEHLLNNFNIEEIQEFFKKIINEKRINELYELFEIDSTIKKDLNIFVEALALQFENYIKYNDTNINTSVKNIYELLIDQYGNGSIENANEKALFSAYQFFYNAVHSITMIRTDKNVLNLKTPFESFFLNIYHAYNAFLSNCNMEGKKLYTEIKNDFLKKSQLNNIYISKISEPGSLPINLVKKIDFIIYDNYKFEDKNLYLSIKLFEENEREKIDKAFKNLNFYPVNEIYFTETISFVEEGSNNNLINETYNICYLTYEIFKKIKENLKPHYRDLREITKEIDSLFDKLKTHSIQYIVDGTYYPSQNKMEYATSIVPTFKKNDNTWEDTGDRKMNLSDHFILGKYSNFEDGFKFLFNYQSLMWKKTGFGDIMAELYTINKDNTFRLFLVPVTSKARIYRLIRDTVKKVFDDEIIAFSFTNIMSYNLYTDLASMNKLLNMSSQARIEIGSDMIGNSFYHDNEYYNLSVTKEDLIYNKAMKKDQMVYGFLKPLINEINRFVNLSNNIEK